MGTLVFRGKDRRRDTLSGGCLDHPGKGCTSQVRRERLDRWEGNAEELHQEGEGSRHPAWSSWWGVREETRFLKEVTMY